MCPPTAFYDGEASRMPATTSSDPVPDFVPAGQMGIDAFNLARVELPPAILNHCLRTFLYAKSLAEAERSYWVAQHKIGILFVGCILHDIGASDSFDGVQRFEVEGADAAASLLRRYSISEPDVREVWQAIALHTSAGIAERISDLARLVRSAVLIDFGKPTGTVPSIGALQSTAEQLFPRLQPEKVLGDAVVAQALRQRPKAPPASWPGILLRAHLDDPGWQGVNQAF